MVPWGGGSLILLSCRRSNKELVEIMHWTIWSTSGHNDDETFNVNFSVWSVSNINKIALHSCLFDISKEHVSSDLLRACFWVSPYSFRKLSHRSTSNTLMARLLTVNSSFSSIASFKCNRAVLFKDVQSIPLSVIKSSRNLSAINLFVIAKAQTKTTGKGNYPDRILSGNTRAGTGYFL